MARARSRGRVNFYQPARCQMQADALKFLADKLDAANPQRRIVTCDREPRHVYYVVDSDGEMVRKLALPEPAQRIAGSLETVVAQIRDWIGADADTALSEVWYSRAGVVGLRDSIANTSDALRDRITLPLKPSPQLAQLIAWDAAKRVTIGQAELILLLRTTFADCTGHHPKLLDSVRKLRVTKAAEVNSQMQQGKVSLGRSMVAEMSGIELIPEEITLQVPVFDSAPLSAAIAGVRVAIDPNPEKEVFTLVVLPGDIEAAFARGEVAIGDKLRELLVGESGGALVSVYYGQP